MSKDDDLSTVRGATEAAFDAVWTARDLCIVMAQALKPNGEMFGPPLMNALGTVAKIAEEHAERAFEAAGIALDLSRQSN